MFGAEFPAEMSALFGANESQLADVKVDVHFHFQGQYPQVQADTVPIQDMPQADTVQVADLQHLLDLVQDETYHPNRYMPQTRVKSTVIVLCLNLFMHAWKLAGHSVSQYEKIPKSSIARLLAYITGIDVRYVEDLVPDTKMKHRIVHLSPDKRKELERLLLDITDLSLQGTRDLLDG